MAYTATLKHIDTCLSCYLSDHHTRNGEMLLGVYVNGNTTREEVKQGLLEEYNTTDFRETWQDVENFDSGACDLACKAAIEKAFEKLDLAVSFDESLDVPPSDNAEDYADCHEFAVGSAEAEDAQQKACDEAQEAWDCLGETAQAWFLLEYEREEEPEAGSDG